MWTLQRPNKGPDKKWRLNKESKYSSLLRPKRKEEDPSLPETPPPSFLYRPLGAPPDPRMMDPRMMNPRIMDPRMMDPNSRVPRVPNGNHRPMDPRPTDPRSTDPRPTEPIYGERIPIGSAPNLSEPRAALNGEHKPLPAEPRIPIRNFDARGSSEANRPIYARPIDPKQPPKMESNSSESDDEPYKRRIRSRSAWAGPGVRDASLDRRPNRLVMDRKGVQSNMDLRMKPLQDLNGRDLNGRDLNGREKHVERFLASLEDNSAAPGPGMEVVSRNRILSRSRDDLITNDYDEDDDVWYDLDDLVKEHVHEILKKWEVIDDGIWAKAIVFEKNRRVAKAYVRAPVLTVNGSDVGFDGHKIGLRGFDNPMRDARTLEVISRSVGLGVKMRMDNKGSIEVKKLSQYNNVYAKPLGEETAINDEICRNPNMHLDSEKQVVFDIKKFEQNVNREVRKAYPNRAKLETQCLMALAFAKPGNILQCPSWVMIINVVAMDMLRSKLPIGLYVKVPSMKNRPRLPVPEEDPYTLTGAGSGASSGGSSGKEKGKDKPPKLPPRDGPASNKSSSKGDYDSPAEESVFRRFQLSRKNNSSNSKEKDRKYDDPYYCGLRARIPNFAKQPKGKDRMEQMGPTRPQYHPHPPHHPMGNASIFHSRSVDSGMASDWDNYWVS